MTSNRVSQQPAAPGLDERKRLEHALQESEDRFRRLVQLSFDVYWETDAEHRFTRQDFASTLHDAPAPGHEIGKTRWEVPYVEPDEDAWRRHRETLAAHLPFRDFELARPTARGGVRHVSVSGFPVFDEGGRFIGYRGVGRNITQLKRAQAQHAVHLLFLQSMDRISRAKQGGHDLGRLLRDVLDATLDIVSCDRAWLLHACDAQLTVWQLDMECARPSLVRAALAPGADVAGGEELLDVFTAAARSGEPLQVLPPSLADRYGVVSQMVMALQPEEDHPYLFCVHRCSHAGRWTDDEQHLFHDIARRLDDALGSHLAIRKLRDSERRLEAAQRVAHVGWWERDYTTTHVLLSDEASRIFGVEPIDMPHWHGRWLSLIHPDDRARIAAALETAMQGGPRYDVEYRVVRPDGEQRMVHSQGDVVWDDSGHVVHQFGVMQDITDLWRAEEGLRGSEARFRTFVDHAADAFFLMDDHLTVVDVNRQACEGLGYAREELIGMRPTDFDVALAEQSISGLAERANAGTITFETRHRRRDGTVFPVEIRSGTFRQGDRLFYLALARDITERKHAEERLRQQDHALQTSRTELAHVSRLTTLGELTSSIAHEVSQPLGAMITSAGACTRWLAAQPPNIAEARSTLDAIAADGRRARDVIGRIRALAKRQVVRSHAVDMNKELIEVLALTEHESRTHRIVRRTDLDPTLPRVPGDRIQLQQVLLNLIVNAIEAMSAIADRTRLLTIRSRHDGPNAVLVEVRDTGSGLDPQCLQQVFEAFYTTKEEGIGIGLSISRSIVEAHGGRLWASVNQPHGANFVLTLPAADGTS